MASILPFAGELVLGVVIGIDVPLVALGLERTRLFNLSASYEPLYAFSVGLLVLVLASVTHGNLFLAAFSAGITTVTVSHHFREVFQEFGELITELLKLAAILVLGSRLSPSFLSEIGAGGYVFTFLALLVVRPLALGISFLGTRLGIREWTAAWFGPKGFASVVYGLIVLESDVALADEMVHVITLVIAASILLHSSTDVVVARQFEDVDLERPR